MRPSVLAAALLCAAVAGCASPLQVGQLLLQQGDLSGAEKQLAIAARQGSGAAWNDLGVVYQREGRTREAIDAFTMGARYGDPTARSNLARSHLPVPPADLAGAAVSPPQDGGPGNLEAVMRGFLAGQAERAAAQPSVEIRPTVTCNAQQTAVGRGVAAQYRIDCQ
jgi:hypothetical protein